MVPEFYSKQSTKHWVLEHLWGYRCHQCEGRFVDLYPRKICPECNKSYFDPHITMLLLRRLH